MSVTHSSRLRLAAAALVPFLASCRSAPSRIFTLEPIAPTEGIARYSGPALRIGAVHIPPSLDRIEIVSMIAAGELKINDMSHWAAPLAQLVRGALTADLMVRLPDGRVTPPDFAAATGAISVEVDILAFIADATGARLHASWIVVSDTSKTSVVSDTIWLEDSTPRAGPAATTQALSTLLARLADRMAANITGGAQ